MERATAAVAAEPPPAPSLDALPGAELLAKARLENFPVALRVLPARERAWLASIYGYARLVDDVGDVHPGDRPALLDWIEEDLERAYEGCAEHVLLRRLTPFLREREVPRDPFLRLIEANRVDQRVTRYATFDDLVGYCRLSADPVGELVLHVFAAATPERVRLSDSVCTALQLAEHWQDVGEDYRRGRIYVPLDDLRRFGVVEDDLAGDVPTDGFRALMGYQVERARGLLAGGVPLVGSLAGRARLAVAAYVGGGAAALDAVAGCGFDVLRRSPRADTPARLRATLRVLREAG